jgi:hypothetical protein
MKEKFKRIFNYEMSTYEDISQEEYERTFEALIDVAEEFAKTNTRFADLMETYGATDGWLGHIPEIIGMLNVLELLN